MIQCSVILTLSTGRALGHVQLVELGLRESLKAASLLVIDVC